MGIVLQFCNLCFCKDFFEKAALFSLGFTLAENSPARKKENFSEYKIYQ